MPRPRLYYRHSEIQQEMLYVALEDYIKEDRKSTFHLRQNKWRFNADQFMKWLFTAKNDHVGRIGLRHKYDMRSNALKMARLLLDQHVNLHFIHLDAGRYGQYIYTFIKRREK